MPKWVKKSKMRGFTLVEMLIAFAVLGILGVAMTNFFATQVRNMKAQNQIVDMQQKLRAGIGMFEREMRMAGYKNPDRSYGNKPTIVSADSNSVYFTQDLNGDGDLNDENEHVAFCVYDSAFGLTQGASNSVQNFATHSHEPIFLDLEDLQLYYTMADGTKITSPGIPGDIRSIEIALLVRSQTSDQNYLDTRVYQKPSGGNWGPYNDAYRRQLLTSTVLCRNMGL